MQTHSEIFGIDSSIYEFQDAPIKTLTLLFSHLTIHKSFYGLMNYDL
jgi:hypothetical protein